MSILHTIRPNGQVESHEWTGKLEYGCPPWEILKRMIGCDTIEHVSVLWHGREAHMFVDETGAIQSPALPINTRATRIYYNKWYSRDETTKHLVCYDFSDQLTGLEEPGFIIVGIALLWEGGLA